jgi:hypothetical protein
MDRVIKDVKLQLDVSLDDFIDRVNAQGYLTKNREGSYRLQTSS